MNQSLLTSLLSDAKLRLRLHTTAFDMEVTDLIEAAATDLIRHNAIQESQLEGGNVDPLIKRAIMTYVRAFFGDPEDPERLKADYENQKAMLMTTSGYTDWGDIDGQK